MSAPHRVAGDDLRVFARRFVLGRIDGFKKDMRICLLTPAVKQTASGPQKTCAFFPALGSCCGTIEYLAGLYAGKLDKLGLPHWWAYTDRYFPKPEYDKDRVRVLHEAFRHSIAHRGISTGIWVDRHHNAQGRRTTWTVTNAAKSPAITITANPGVLSGPWGDATYTHLVHIRVMRLAITIRASARLYLAALEKSAELLGKFGDCMEELYPR